MKELTELQFPEELRYAKDHEWIRPGGDTVRVGISDYAQDQLGDIVYVELPQPGDTFSEGDPFGTVESVKAVSELYLPVSGEVVSINKGLEDAPENVNSDPYGEGWMVELRPGDPAEIDRLMARDAYIDMLKGL